MPATSTLNGALAGAAAAALWAAQQPLDKRVFGSSYDDVRLLGGLFTRGAAEVPAGLAMHLQNGAVFGAVYVALKPLLPGPPAARGLLMALAEHLALWPLTGNRRAFAAATWRHALFGLALGALEHRLNREEPAGPPPASSNGRGSLEATAVAA